MPTYLDASALLRRAETLAPNPTARSTKAGTPVSALLNAGGGDVATSIVGLAEFHDVATRFWRSNSPENQEHDEAWCDLATNQTLHDVESGRLAILALPDRAFEQAMAQVTMATRKFGRGLRIWDAIHIRTALGWSVELGTAVELWTTDRDYKTFFNVFPDFEKNIVVVNLDD